MKKNPAKAKRRYLRWALYGVAAGALGIGLVGWHYIVSPLRVLDDLAEAQLNGDRAEIRRCIDFPALRQSLFERLDAAVTEQFQQQVDIEKWPPLLRAIGGSEEAEWIGRHARRLGLRASMELLICPALMERLPMPDPDAKVSWHWIDRRQVAFSHGPSAIHLHYRRGAWRVYNIEWSEDDEVAIISLIPLSLSSAADGGGP